MKLKGSSWFELAIVIISVVMLVISTSYNEKARLFPMVISVILIVVMVLLFLQETVPAASRYLGFIGSGGLFASRKSASGKDEGESDKAPNAAAQHGEVYRLFRFILWLLGCIIMLKFVTYLIVMPVFLLLFTKVEARQSWRNAVGVALGMGVFNYLLFTVLLGSTI